MAQGARRLDRPRGDRHGGVRHYLRPVAKVETVISGEAVDAEPGSLTVKEKYSMQMKSQVAGRVLSKDYKLDTGLNVKEGDVLVHLDTSELEIEIEQVHNEYEAAKQRIAVGSAQTYALETAQSDFKNTERLFKMGQLSDSEYQKARRAGGDDQAAAGPGKGPRRRGPEDRREHAKGEAVPDGADDDPGAVLGHGLGR